MANFILHTSVVGKAIITQSAGNVGALSEPMSARKLRFEAVVCRHCVSDIQPRGGDTRSLQGYYSLRFVPILAMNVSLFLLLFVEVLYLSNKLNVISGWVWWGYHIRMRQRTFVVIYGSAPLESRVAHDVNLHWQNCHHPFMVVYSSVPLQSWIAYTIMWTCVGELSIIESNYNQISWDEQP